MRLRMEKVGDEADSLMEEASSERKSSGESYLLTKGIQPLGVRGMPLNSYAPLSQAPVRA